MILCFHHARCADNSAIGMIGSHPLLKQLPGFWVEHNTVVKPPDFSIHWSPLIFPFSGLAESLKLNDFALTSSAFKGI